MATGGGWLSNLPVIRQVGLAAVPEDVLARPASFAEVQMEGVYELAVPLVVDQKDGRSWLEVT